MSTPMPVATPLVHATANDALKRGFAVRFWKSLAAATVLHFLLLALWPAMRAADYSIEAGELRQIDLLPEVEIPPPPEEIARPAVPMISADLELSDDITIDPTTFEENPVAALPPPPRPMDTSDQPRFTPYEVHPELRNRGEFLRALQRGYPATLRDAGIGGTVLLWVRLDEAGTVLDTRVIESSGQPRLDALAQELIRDVARFSPALNREQTVPVWIQMPVTFQVQ